MADTMAWSIRQYISEIYAPQNIHIESTLKALCLLVSEIDVLLRKWAAILYKWLTFLKSTHHKTYTYSLL